MIAEARGVPAGAGLTNYITKNERAEIVRKNLLTDGLTYQGMWDEMNLHFKRYQYSCSRRPIKYHAVELTVSLAPEESEGMSREELGALADEVVRTLDTVDEVTDNKGIKHSNLKKTTLANSQYFAGVHRDSKGGKIHFHLLANRIDNKGEMIDLHYIGLRAVQAADIVNRRHGWVDPMKIHEANVERINKACESMLLCMDKFDLDRYLTGLRRLGWDVRYNPDTKGIVHGYTFYIGNCRYKASELGKGRCYTVTNLGKTWKMLHRDMQEESLRQRQQVPVPVRKPRMNLVDKYAMEQERIRRGNMGEPNSSDTKSAYFTSLVSVKGRDYNVTMPWTARDAMEETIDETDYGSADKNDVMNVAMLLFLGYVDAATTYNISHGGCGHPGTGWGKDSDEDDIRRARRAALKACALCKPVKRSRGR